MFKVNDLVRVSEKGLFQESYIGRVEEVDPDYSKHGTMVYVTHLTDENGKPFPKEEWDEDWFFEDQLEAYDKGPKVGQSLVCIDAHDQQAWVKEGNRYTVLAVNYVGAVCYVTVRITHQVIPGTFDSHRFSLVMPLRFDAK